jgi:UDP-N-acetylglucosamine--dolichyl-phosphate N-acetylglucosaminephosphotransferase
LALTLAEGGLLLLSFGVPLVLVVGSMPTYLRYLVRKGRVVDDAHKSPPTKVPSPVGPVIFAGIVIGEAVAYLAFGSMVPIALLGTAALAFTIGLVDDLWVLGGKTKPILLLLAGLPLVLSITIQNDLYEPHLIFPILGSIGEHLIIYTALVVIAFPIVANAFNMMDSFNGQLSWFSLLTSLALLFGVVLHAAFTTGFSLARVAATLPLVAVSAGFLAYNRYPSKAFDGDSGSLLLGAVFAGLAVVDGVEIAAIIAIVPAILNSFYTLSSVRGFVERRKMATRPTYVGEDGRLYASLDPSSPTTLVRLVLLDGPRSEKDLVKDVVTLTIIACLLSGLISVLTWVI